LAASSVEGERILLLNVIFGLLALASAALAFSGYVLLRQLQPIPFPFSTGFLTLSGRLAQDTPLTVGDLARFGYVAESVGPGQFRLRPRNHYEQVRVGGTSANPYDYTTAAFLLVKSEHWVLEVRRLLGAPLGAAICATWYLVASEGSLLAFFWILLGIASFSFESWRLRAAYLRLQGQLARLDGQGSVQQAHEAVETRRFWR